MADTPGRILSSLSNADGRNPKVGGCVGVFFQLFDWNRRLSGKHLFANKSLPAERPRSRKFSDEKVTMAKLLLIADENRGGLPRDSSSECLSEVGSERSSDAPSKRPGVVARLMGLESLPDTENQPSQSKELKQQQQQQQKMSKIQQYQELQMLENLLQREPEDLWRMPLSRKERVQDPPRSSAEFRESPSKSFLKEEKMPKARKKIQDQAEKIAHSPKKSGFPLTSVLSPSKSNKATPPIKSQSTSSSKRTALLIGAATKILETGGTRTRPLLEHKVGTAGDKARVDNNLKKPKGGKDDVPNASKAGKAGNCKGSGKNGKQQGLLHLGQDYYPTELDDEVEGDSQASSCKENSSVQKLAATVLRRSGSVKEEQPPTPPSRGSLFRSKSVKEETQAVQPQQDHSPQDCSGRSTASGTKEVRLKREKKQRSSPSSLNNSDASLQKPEHVRRKPALDQGKGASRASQQESHQRTTTKREPVQERAPKSSILSYDRLFGSKKQDRGTDQAGKEEGSAKKIERSKKSIKAEPVSKSKSTQKKSGENSLMKSLLRRKPLNKAETISSANKKVLEKTKSKEPFPIYERQVRSAGSSPARNFKEQPECDLHLICDYKSMDEDKYTSDPEVLKERNQDRPRATDTSHVKLPEQLHSDISTDKTLDEILKTYVFKNFKGGDCDENLGNRALEQEEADDGDDPNVIDMEVSPSDNDTLSRCHVMPEGLPNKVLFKEDEQQIKTPSSPNKTPPEAPAKVNGSGPEDCGQPSPVSVLDFSAFPSDITTTTTSGDDSGEDGKNLLMSDAESAPDTSKGDTSTVNRMTMQGILDSYAISFAEVSEAKEEVASCGSHEIECYVREVLTTSGLVTDDPIEAQKEVPSQQEIWQRLQKQQQIRGLLECASQMQLCSKRLEAPGSCHRLMYECIDEALNLVLEPFRCNSLSSIVDQRGCCWKHRPFGEELVGEVTNQILSWREMTLGSVDELVEVDMSAASEKWSMLMEETLEVGLEVERMVFRSLVEETITDLIETIPKPALLRLPVRATLQQYLARPAVPSFAVYRC